MTVVIAVLNRKGGVGKTTLTKDLSHALVASGRRVLQVGLDPQSSLEVLAGLGFDTPPEQTVSRLLLPEEFPAGEPLDAVVHATPWAAALVPASKALASAERALGEPGRGGANQRLRRGIERLGVDELYDLATGGLAGREHAGEAPQRRPPQSDRRPLDAGAGGESRVRLGVELSEHETAFLRALSRPARTGGPRTLGSKFVGTGILAAAIEMLAESGIDMYGLAAGDLQEMTARARAALLRAGAAEQTGEVPDAQS